MNFITTNFNGINFLAVFVAAVACMPIAFLWYSPILFARPWMVDMGMDPDNKEAIVKMQKSAGPLYGIAFVASLMTALVLAKLFAVMGVVTTLHGIKIAFAAWLGFVAMVQLTDMLFSRKRPRLFFVNTGYQFICYLAMGAILGLWH